MRIKPFPSTHYINECFTYDPENGKLFWKERPLNHFKDKRGWIFFNSRFASTVAGCEVSRRGMPHSLMVHITVNDVPMSVKAHQLIHAIMGITIPNGFLVDHKDTNPFNNRWDNLRLATPSQNIQNAKGHIDSMFPKGVSRGSNSTFRAKITVNGETICIGCYPTVEQAHAAYCAAAQDANGEFARFN